MLLIFRLSGPVAGAQGGLQAQTHRRPRWPGRPRRLGPCVPCRQGTLSTLPDTTEKVQRLNMAANASRGSWGGRPLCRHERYPYSIPVPAVVIRRPVPGCRLPLPGSRRCLGSHGFQPVDSGGPLPSPFLLSL